MSAHSTKPDNLYTANTDLGPDTWPRFIYNSMVDISNDHECAAVCFLIEGPCHFYYTDTTNYTCTSSSSSTNQH